MNWKTTLSTLMLVAALPLGAIAATPAQPSTAAPAAAGKEVAPPLFMELDKNHDNYLSADEVKRSAEVSARFKDLDSNHDGRISVHEYLQGKMS